MHRALKPILCAWLGLWLIGGAAAADAESLQSFAVLLGLEEVDEFVAAVETIRATGDLPDDFLTKGEARDEGWRPGHDLCRYVPGATIGGSRFQNRERRLPDAPGRRWKEADLDFDCGRRGARRLVFSNDGLVYVTLDHYESFYEVPR